MKIPDGKPLDYYMRKADQHWVMFSLAGAEGDWKDADRHRTMAKEYERKVKEIS